MSTLQIFILAVIQGMAELLPVSSSAHVIVAEKLMGIDPSTPEMTFLLVMLHTGTMFAVLVYFWPRWKKLSLDFFKSVVIATAATGAVGLGLKKFIEKVILEKLLGHEQGEVETLFKSLPLMGCALLGVGLLILFAGSQKKGEGKNESSLLEKIPVRESLWIGIVQGLCLPFRGFSRSGATISVSLLFKMRRALAEDFSFALAVVLTPPVILLELHRLTKGGGMPVTSSEWTQLLLPGLVGMVFSFGAGLFALRWLSRWLEMGRWKYFGFYCILASLAVFLLWGVGY